MSSKAFPGLPAFDAATKLAFQTSIPAALHTEFVPILSQASIVFSFVNQENKAVLRERRFWWILEVFSLGKWKQKWRNSARAAPVQEDFLRLCRQLQAPLRLAEWGGCC